MLRCVRQDMWVILKSAYKIIGISQNKGRALTIEFNPPFKPQIKTKVEVNISQYRRYYTSLCNKVNDYAK